MNDLPIAIERLKEGWDSVGVDVNRIPSGVSEDEIVSRTRVTTGLVANEELVTWFQWQGGDNKTVWIPGQTLSSFQGALDDWRLFNELAHDPSGGIDGSFMSINFGTNKYNYGALRLAQSEAPGAEVGNYVTLDWMNLCQSIVWPSLASAVNEAAWLYQTSQMEATNDPFEPYIFGPDLNDSRLEHASRPLPEVATFFGDAQTVN